MRLVRLTLHVDAFDMAAGGAWEVRTVDGLLLALEATPGFPGGEQTMEAAAGWLADQCRARCPGGQLVLF